MGRVVAPDLMNTKRKVRGQSDQTYEIFHLNACVLICFIQFSMLENVNSGSRKKLIITISINIAIVTKLTKHFI